MMDIFKEYLSKLTGAFNVDHGPNVQKLVRFFAVTIGDVKDMFHAIGSYRNIDFASGKLLDEIGNKLNVNRGKADDRFYRIMLKSKIASRRGDTTIDGILTTIKNSFGIDIKGIKIIKHPYEPLTISIVDIPLDIAQTEWEQNYLMQRIKSAVAVGVRVDEVRLIDNASKTVLILSGTTSAIIYDET